MSARLKLAVGYESLGPYHVARLAALATDAELLAIEFTRKSATYDWRPAEAVGFRRVTLATDENAPRRESRLLLETALRDFAPDVVFAPGWASWQSLAMLDWCLKSHIPAVVMSDSQQIDDVRSPHKEFVKSRLLGLFDGAFVAGSSHVDYLQKLGFRRPMATGYDVVDNRHFALPEDKEADRSDFLCCARLVEKKNVGTLIRAYKIFLNALGPGGPTPPKLIIAGDGSLRTALEAQIEELELSGKAILCGFVDYQNLPSAYRRALVFVLPSTTEQWGLVVNEAMAAGCAVIVSSRAGCAPELVREGENGFLIDPVRPEGLADRLMWAHRHREALEAMGRRSIEIVSSHTPATHAEAAVDLAYRVKRSRYGGKSLAGKLVLKAMLARPRAT